VEFLRAFRRFKSPSSELVMTFRFCGGIFVIFLLPLADLPAKRGPLNISNKGVKISSLSRKASPKGNIGKGGKICWLSRLTFNPNRDEISEAILTTPFSKRSAKLLRIASMLLICGSLVGRSILVSSEIEGKQCIPFAKITVARKKESKM